MKFLNLFNMKLIVIISTLIVCVNLSAQKEQAFRSKWLDNSTGTSAPSVSDYLSAKNGAVLYCLSNDDKNLYVNVRFTESIEQAKVLQIGLIVWVNTDGKSRKMTGIRYPIGAKFSGLQDQNNAFNQATPLSMANTIELIGFKDVETTRFPSNNTDNFRGFVKYDNDGNLLYSMTVPLSKLPAGSKSSDGKTVPMNLAIEYGAPPEMGEQSGRPSGYTPPPKIMGERNSRGGGGGGGRGGSRGGSAGGEAPKSTPNGQDTPKPVIIWMKNIILSEKM